MILRFRFAFFGASLLCVIWSSVAFSQVVRIDHGVIVNALPVDVAVRLTVQDSNNGTAFRSLIVPGRSNFPAPAGFENASIDLFEPIDVHPTIKNNGNCRAVSYDKLIDEGQLKEQLSKQLKDLELTETPEGYLQKSATENVATLEMQNKLDVIDTWQHDPRFEERNDQLADKDPQKAEENERERNQQAYLEKIAAMAEEYARVDGIRRDQYKQEKTLLEPLVAQAAETEKSLKDLETRASQHTDAGIAFLSLVTQKVDSMASPREPLSEPISPVHRSCSKEGNSSEYVEFDLDAPTSTNVLIGEAKFDKGASYSTTFRHVADTKTWRGLMFWPTSADHVSFRVRVPGSTKWTKVNGEITLAAKSLTENISNIVNHLRSIKKKYEKAKFGAQGGETIMTSPIP